MDKKDLSKEQMARRMQNALVFVPKDKDYKGVYFGDKGLRLEVSDDTAVVSTGFHQHIFRRVTASGISRPYIYVSQFIDIALANEDCKTADGYSYSRLFSSLKEKEDKTDYNICWYIDLWLFNIFQPLYSIGESEAEMFLVYETYLHNIARNAVTLGTKEKDITNRSFIEMVIGNEKAYVEGLEEKVIFPKEEQDAAEKEQDALNQVEIGKEVKHGTE